MADQVREQDRERWTKLVADYEASELTQREFASERDVSFSNLRNWLYRLRQESRPLVTKGPASSGQGPTRAARKERSRLLPVRVVASAPKARLLEAVPRMLELGLPSGVMVRFPGTEPATCAGVRHLLPTTSPTRLPSKERFPDPSNSGAPSPAPMRSTSPA